jgi:hypothetical protein
VVHEDQNANRANRLTWIHDEDLHCRRVPHRILRKVGASELDRVQREFRGVAQVHVFY